MEKISTKQYGKSIRSRILRYKFCNWSQEEEYALRSQARICGNSVAVRAILLYVHYKLTAKRQILPWICSECSTEQQNR